MIEEIIQSEDGFPFPCILQRKMQTTVQVYQSVRECSRICLRHMSTRETPIITRQASPKRSTSHCKIKIGKSYEASQILFITDWQYHCTLTKNNSGNKFLLWSEDVFFEHYFYLEPCKQESQSRVCIQCNFPKRIRIFCAWRMLAIKFLIFGQNQFCHHIRSMYVIV